MTSVNQPTLNVVRHSLRNRGGDAVILERMSFLAEQGWDVQCFVSQVDTHFPVNPKIKLKYIPGKNILFTICFALMHRYSKGIVLVDLAVMALFVSLRNRFSVILFAQEDDRSYYQSRMMKILILLVYKVIFRIKIPLICVSDSLAARFSLLGASRVISVPNGIDLQLFSRQEMSPFFNEKGESVAIIVHARDDHRKGFDVAIKAIEKLYSFKPHGWEIWVIGQEIPLFRTPGVSIKKFGLLNEKQLSECLSAGDIFLSSSRHEGFGLLQLQAMACGCALVTTDAFVLAEHEVNALVTAVDDSSGLAQCLDRLISDPQLRTRLSKSATNLVSAYSRTKSDQLFQESLRQCYSDHSAVS